MGKYYQNITTGSPSAIKRFSHNKRFETVLAICKKLNAKTMLDIGTGDAYFIKLAHQSSLNMELMHALEPKSDLYEEGLEMTAKIANAKLFKNWASINQTYDIVTCQEVFEHLPADETLRLLEKIREHMNPKGHLIVTVPIESGLAGFVKNIVRFAIGAKHDNASLKNVIKSALGITIDRAVSADNYIYSHIGFNHKLLEQAFKNAKYAILNTSYSPFPYSGTIVNAQKIYLLQPI